MYGHGHQGHGHQQYPQQQQQQYGGHQPQLFHNVTVRSYTNPNHYLFVSNDNHRHFNSDYDVRTHACQEERNKFTIEHFGNGLCRIKHQMTGHYLFAADDGSRKYGDDFDVRTHTHDEQRNKVNVMKTQTPGVYAIGLTTHQHYIFCSNDGANGYGQDYDVRSHPHIEDRNMWLFDGFYY